MCIPKNQQNLLTHMLLIEEGQSSHMTQNADK